MRARVVVHHDAAQVRASALGTPCAGACTTYPRPLQLRENTRQEAIMPRGDGLNDEILFSDRDDDEDYGGFGGSSYD
ncbi:MAG TPA: hypothetical protein VFS05_15200, partial [Gemmatimonadaceae bacterium]|nr:hypothetical protein [Gemmatimonadaceae bacterium]